MIAGSCLCAKVRYAVEAELGDIIHCHCVTCRKAHAAAFSSVAAIQDKSFTIQGREELSSFESSPGKTRYFCSNCGTQIYAKREGTKHVVLRLGSLDSPVEAKEVKHIWVSQKASWYTIDSELPQCWEFE